jgi:hypothetical protein
MKKAFTLIELLVVIAIIAILAAILFPVFAQAKAAAKKTSDLSNVKNMSTAFFLYSGDADDMFPRGVYKSGVNLGGWDTPITWREAIMPYVKNGQKKYTGGGNAIQLADGGIFDTPAKPGVRGAYSTNRTLTPGYCYWNHNANSWDCDSSEQGVANGKPVFPSVSQTALDAPAQIASILTIGINPDWNASGDFSDTGWWWMGGAQWPPVFTGPTSHEKWDADSNQSPSWSVPRYRYNGLNAGFADGHAKFVKKGALNFCQYFFVKGLNTDLGDNWDWLIDPGNPCAAFAR